VLDDVQHPQAAHEHGTGMEEVRRQDRRRLGIGNARQVCLNRVGARPVSASVRIRHTAGGAPVSLRPTSSPWMRR
jgi:hypothetical protein